VFTRTRHRLVLLVALAVAIGVSAAAASAGGARVVGNCTKSQVRPSQIILFCADANAALTHLHWQSFGGSAARATGDYTANDCKPACYDGHVHSYPVTIVFSEPKRCPDGHDDYRVATAVYSSSTRPSGPQGGKGYPGQLSLYCPLPG